MKTDLNLLVVFDAVARAGSVTGAAVRLSLSQPAISHALNRLRDLLGDPLFTRKGRGLVATPRAMALMVPIRDALQSIEGLMAPVEFDAASEARCFRIGASDYASLTLVAPLLRKLRDEAKLVTLDIVPVGNDTLLRLESGLLDLSFWGTVPPEGDFRHAALFREHYVGLVCSRHPIIKGQKVPKVSLEQYLSYPHAVVSLKDPGRNAVDETLAKFGKRRKIGIATQSFVANVHFLEGSDLIAAMPARLCEGARAAGLVAFKLPIAVPDYEYGIVWHRRTDADAAFIWLRKAIRSLC